MLGIIGGMGPLATAAFYRRLIILSGDRLEAEHIPIIIIGDPRVPSRPAALRAGSMAARDAVRDGLLKSVLRAERAGARLLIMPCNTAHAWAGDIAAAATVPFLSMITAVVDELARTTERMTRIGMLGTSGTVDAEVYDPQLAAVGRLVVKPTEGEQALVDSAISSFKRGDMAAGTRFRDAAIRGLADRADAIVLACTELSMTPLPSTPVTVIDSADCLARAAILKVDELAEQPLC
ncbi:MAG: amino acid racemase [Pacificimonas sp.]